MGLPSQPITLSAEQIAELNGKLSTLRHDINNHLALIGASGELVRYKPEMLERMLSTVAEQPRNIVQALNNFSVDFEKAMGITRS